MFYDTTKCLSIKHEIHFTENLGSKHSLLTKFGMVLAIVKDFG